MKKNYSGLTNAWCRSLDRMGTGCQAHYMIDHHVSTLKEGIDDDDPTTVYFLLYFVSKISLVHTIANTHLQNSKHASGSDYNFSFF